MLSRREMLMASLGALALTAVPFPDWLAKQAEARMPRLRCDAGSPEGRAMLKTLARGVAWMRRQPVADSSSPAPRPGDSLPPGPPGVDDAAFLPWHRMHVYFLERIIQDVTGDDTFAMPYWSPAEMADPAGRAVPPAFLARSHPELGPLRRPGRSAWANSGQPVTGPHHPDIINMDALRQPHFLPLAAATERGDIVPAPGFSKSLAGGLDAVMRDLLGAGDDVIDPLMWLHACNLDRIWSAWNSRVGDNPVDVAFLGRSFAFVDAECRVIAATTGDFLDTMQLGYCYDCLPDTPDLV